MPFTAANPVPSQTVGEMLAGIKWNATNLRSMLVHFGLQGFNYSVTAGTNEFPEGITFTNVDTDYNITLVISYLTSVQGNKLPTSMSINHNNPIQGVSLNAEGDILVFGFNSDDILIGTEWFS